MLNFFRFVQRRLLVATATFVTEMDEGKGSEYIGQGLRGQEHEGNEAFFESLRPFYKGFLHYY